MTRSCPAGAHDPSQRPPRPGTGPRGNSFANSPNGGFKQLLTQLREITAAFDCSLFGRMEPPLPW